MKQKKTLEEQYPSIDIAYDIALKSYETTMKRSDVADDGIDKLRTLITTINLAFLAWIISTAKVGAMFNAWFILSLYIYFSTIVISIIAKSANGIILVDPKIIYNKYLHFSKWEFKKNIIYWAGEHYKINGEMVANKAKYIVCIFSLFLLEVVTMGYWLVKYSH